jgi:GNAT superfamily N-acetyltransferase
MVGAEVMAVGVAAAIDTPARARLAMRTVDRRRGERGGEQTMTDFVLRPMERSDWSEVAELIHVGTNAWYQANGRAPIFSGDPAHTELFCQVYEALDPGCCVLAVNARTGRIAGSCFYHPRPTHVSVGIMNVHPNYFGRGIARQLLRFITDVATRKTCPCASCPAP